MRYAYCRVSTSGQSLERQHAAIAEAYPDIPAENYIDEKKSGKDFERENYLELRRKMVKGDELVVPEVDRLGRNKRLTERERYWLYDHGIILRVLEIPQTLEDNDDLDARMMIDIQFLIKEYQAERELLKIHKRQAEGTAAKIANGTIKNAGRPRIDISDAEFMLAARRYKQKHIDFTQFLIEANMSEATAFRRLRKIKADPVLNAELWRPLETGKPLPAKVFSDFLATT